MHIMKYIFPRQFRLHNVFTSTVDSRETIQPLKDYTLRENEICQSARKTSAARVHDSVGNQNTLDQSRLPKRLRGLPVDLVRKLQVQHLRCSYVELLKHYCGGQVSHYHLGWSCPHSSNYKLKRSVYSSLILALEPEMPTILLNLPLSLHSKAP